jgi:cell division protein FtsB
MPALKPSAPSFSLVEGYKSLPLRRNNPRLFITLIAIVGFLGIGVGNLLLNIATSAGVYQLAHLKAEKKQLALNSQILGAQVQSLSSNQNLANAARELGMQSNANPVFLNVTSQEVYGKALAAVNSTADRISRNLVPNSLLTTTTTAALKAAEEAANKSSATANVAATSVATGTTATAPSTKPAVSENSGWTAANSGYVGGAKSSPTKVVSSNSGIPAAASH